MDHLAHGARAIGAVALIGITGGCASSGEQLTPEAGVGGVGAVYALRMAAGATVPAVWLSNEYVTITVVADTIRLRKRGEGKRVLVERYQESTQSAARTRREAGTFAYERRGDRIAISLPCPDLALCVAPPHFVGRFTEDGIIFDQAINYRTPLRYERVSR